MLATLTAWTLTWLVVGGVTYTLGAAVYSFKMFNFKLGAFGFHEVWHVFVLLAAAAHFVSVLSLAMQ
jgi:hemolysin III